LFSLVRDPGRLSVAWEHVARNKGSRTAGIDGLTARRLEAAGGVGVFLKDLSGRLRAGVCWPSPVRRVTIPKPGGKTRPLGIPTIADRVVQESLKMVLEPIFEADFLPVSYGFRPMRRAQDAVAVDGHVIGPPCVTQLVHPPSRNWSTERFHGRTQDGGAMPGQGGAAWLRCGPIL
jgi:RNA-directed DNA polymerase